MMLILLQQPTQHRNAIFDHAITVDWTASSETLTIYFYGEKLLRFAKPFEVYMHEEVLTTSIVHTI